MRPRPAASARRAGGRAGPGASAWLLDRSPGHCPLGSWTFVQYALELQQAALHRQAAAVAAEGAAGAQDAVAGDDERDRVAATGGAGGPDGALVAGLARDLGVAAGLAVGDSVDCPQGPLAEAAAEAPVERQVEAVELALEVEVELAADLVQLRRRLEDPRRDPRGEVDQQLVGFLIRQSDPDQAAPR